MRERTVSSVMTTDVVSVEPDASLKEIAELLSRHRISAVAVVSESGRLIGVVSEDDLLLKEAYRRSDEEPTYLASPAGRGRWEKSRGLCAADVMTVPVTVAPDKPLSEAARMLHARRLHRLFVLSASPPSRLLGVVARSDVVRLLAQQDEHLKLLVEHELSTDPRSPGTRRVRVAVDEGVVTLSGEVQVRSTAASAERIARAVPGVVAVRSTVRWRYDDVGVGSR